MINPAFKEYILQKSETGFLNARVNGIVIPHTDLGLLLRCALSFFV